MGLTSNLMSSDPRIFNLEMCTVFLCLKMRPLLRFLGLKIDLLGEALPILGIK